MGLGEGNKVATAHKWMVMKMYFLNTKVTQELIILGILHSDW